MIINYKLVVMFDFKGQSYDCLINRDRDIETLDVDWVAEDIFTDEDGESPYRFDIYGALIDGAPSTDYLDVYVTDGDKTIAKISNIEILECE